MNLIFQRVVDLTALTVEELRGFVVTLLHAPKSSEPSLPHRSGSRSRLALSHGQVDEYEGHWVLMRMQEKKDSSTFARTSSGSMTRSSAIG